MTIQVMQKILVIGANGQLGRALLKELDPDFHVIAATRNSKPAFDLSQPQSLLKSLNSIKPDIIINAAAYTAVDKAESEYLIAHTINAVSPGVISAYCSENIIPLIHYSTDYVFDGCKNSPYTENDSPNPQNVYGTTKLGGEQAITQSGCNHLILRTGWVYDHQGKNFLNTMLKLAGERDILRIVDDQTGGPTWTGYLANETARIAKNLLAGEQEYRSGIYHLTCSGEISWRGFAEEIFKLARSFSVIEKDPKLIPVSSDEYPTPAQRPHYSVLNNKKAHNHLNCAPMSWQKALKACMQNFV